ncbi:tetrapyrrole biosynthesis, uroporphyrinogen III synthase [Tricharina praecox]|uniref:tetrapyrrole biosynthesis, uroporphyrinogen III synthase n=1 Tax=Tricharina praecox TaxID=43433 RepID=UPI002220D16F|nr:tetrapyrrole biosynthesis, uroporphyrinogen III synthase [Tricharina praecox]KAI5851063.1 tetrapyrrole biosynthesis, uroporphyrinogen III synthase [Tricharina praecox]
MSQPTPTPTRILLLKTQSQPTDPYLTYFTTHPLPYGPSRPTFIPVLSHTPTNLSTLRTLLTSTPSPYGGLIITSQRAVASFSAALSTLPCGRASADAFLASTSVYTVGPATAAAVAALGFRAENIHGKGCGTGIALAEVVLRHYASDSSEMPGQGDRPLLFCNSAARGEWIPKALEGRVELQELMVYETKVEEGFAGEFARVLMEGMGEERWIVVFSPAGAEQAVEIVRGMEGAEGAEDAGRTLWAAIGPTTEKHLESLGRRPEVVAARPSPEGVWTAIREFVEREEKEKEAR